MNNYIFQAFRRNMENNKRNEILKLIEAKSMLENRLAEQNEILNRYNVGMDEPLVDEQGYPRADIDVYQVRHARHRIICLCNDLRLLFKKIEEDLIIVHAEVPYNPDLDRRMTELAADENFSKHADSVPRNPFVIVTMVVNGSPADIAGLCKNDKIIQFGSLTSTNFTCMDDIYKLVTHSVGQPINVQVTRGPLVVGLTLVPKPWSNRGLLGCHIQKFN